MPNLSAEKPLAHLYSPRMAERRKGVGGHNVLPFPQQAYHRELQLLAIVRTHCILSPAADEPLSLLWSRCHVECLKFGNGSRPRRGRQNHWACDEGTHHTYEIIHA